MLKLQSDCAVVYHWWTTNPILKPEQDQGSPVVLAIATLRAFDTKCPIYVIDVSEDDHDWSDWPEQLNFTVVKKQPAIPKNRLCSRVWDVWSLLETIPEKKFLFTDSDVFWIKSPFPLDKENNGSLNDLYCLGNTGIWYGDKSRQNVIRKMTAWKSVISWALNDPEAMDMIRSHVGYKFHGFQDEVAFNYMSWLYHNRTAHPVRENCTACNLRMKNFDFASAKNLHLLGAFCGAYRAYAAFRLKETNDVIRSFLTEDQISRMYGEFFIEPLSVEEIKGWGILELRKFFNAIVHTGIPI